MHLTSNNVTNWEHYLDDKLTALRGVGQAIRNKTPFVLTKPTINDLFEDTNLRMYNLQGHRLPLLILAPPTSSKLTLLSRKMTRNVAMKKPRSVTSSYPSSPKKRVCNFDQSRPSRKL